MSTRLVYEPGARPAVSKLTMIVEGEVPLEGATLSHAPPATEAVQGRATALVRLRVTGVGLNPAIAPRLSWAGVTASVETVNDHVGPVLVVLNPTTSTRQ